MSDPLSAFRFRIDFYKAAVDAAQRPPDQARPSGERVPLCGGSFSECSGLEATMEPKVIRAGGNNYGDHQRAGYVSFATVVLKRGITASRSLWLWFDFIARGQTAPRLTAELVHLLPGDDPDTGGGALIWEMRNALPVKFKAATYNATAADVGVEELHFVHEGLRLRPGPAAPGRTGP